MSEDDIRGRDLFVSWCKDAGCEVQVDQVGNIYASRPGREANRLPAATGSHLDTQPHGGKFDGVYGVLAGLEVVRALNDANVHTMAPIDVVVWTNEEGVRFSPPLAGSCAYAGTVAIDTVHEAETIDGTRVKDDLISAGYMGDLTPGERQFDCFIEAHIEQGPILEASETQIGVVTGVQGIGWLVVTVKGQDAHAGTTPMDRRRDAVVGVARMISAVNALPALTDSDMRLTIGRIDVEPNSGATIPGRVQFNCDVRHPDLATLENFIASIQSAVCNIASDSGLDVEFEHPIQIAPTLFAKDIVDLIRKSATDLGFSNRDMLSGAGHDAMNVARVVASGMLFVPCKGGISHNEAESATAEDLATGAETLLRVLLDRAGTVPA